MLWSRLGAFDPAQLERLLWTERALIEWIAFLYPVEELPALRAQMRAWPDTGGGWADKVNTWLDANASFRRYVRRELRRRGPLASRDLEDRAVVPWASSGWTGNRNVGRMLEFLCARGEIAVVGRRRNDRLWDLAERWYPPGRALRLSAAKRHVAARRLRSLGITRDGLGTPAVVEGVPGTWRVDPEALPAVEAPTPSRTTLLSPFDRLIHDRDRAEALFGFRYRIEIYVPKAKREYGYFVLSILHNDRLVGRLDPELDREQGVLRVHAVYAEPGAPESAGPAIAASLHELATWLGAAEVAFGSVPDVWRRALR